MTNLSHYSKEDFFEICKQLPYDIVEIVYDYYHRDKTYTVEAYAMSKKISVATLYRYKNKIESEFKRHQ